MLHVQSSGAERRERKQHPSPGPVTPEGGHVTPEGGATYGGNGKGGDSADSGGGQTGGEKVGHDILLIDYY